MIRGTWWLALGLILFIGCDRPQPAATTTVAEAEPAETPLEAGEIDNIKKLPEGDRQAALTQKVCPISGGHLGAMGAPVKVGAKGKTAFLCCKGCVEDFEHDPGAALAKLKK